MKILILSDYYDNTVEEFLRQHSKATYNKSGLNYQENILKGFINVLGKENVYMLSCPTCGVYPYESTLLHFPKFKSSSDCVKYVGFNNLIYYRNISRYLKLKKEAKIFLESLEKNEELLVLTIQMHYPFMKVIKFLKKKHQKTKACINIWDFPNYVDFKNNSLIKRFLKGINCRKTYNLLKYYDLFFYLCRGMVEKNKYNSSYIIHEGIISDDQINRYAMNLKNFIRSKSFCIVYTGRLSQLDGIMDIISAVNKIDADIVLKIAGGGELASEIKRIASKSKKIVFYGSLSRKEVIKLQCSADLFVLARLKEDFTKYSFPSKMCEYILTGKPILARPLECFDSELKNNLLLFDDDDNSNLDYHIRNAIETIVEKGFRPDYSSFISKNISSNVARDIINNSFK